MVWKMKVVVFELEVTQIDLRIKEDTEKTKHIKMFSSCLLRHITVRILNYAYKRVITLTFALAKQRCFTCVVELSSILDFIKFRFNATEREGGKGADRQTDRDKERNRQTDTNQRDSK